MAFYPDEEDIYKCPKHPFRRRKIGICPICLSDRLITLCPECANTRPCPCYPADSASTSSSSSSSFSLFQFSRADGFYPSAREVGRMSNLIDSEPPFRRSRSLAIPLFKSRSKHTNNSGFDRDFVHVQSSCLPQENNKELVEADRKGLTNVRRGRINFWSLFRTRKSNKCDLHDDELKKSDVYGYSKMLRSRSVAVGAGDGSSPSTAKRRGWYFPSPIKAFRQSKTSKLQQHERSPMHRG